MPKERIAPLASPYEVQISWAVDSDVQLGVAEQEARSLLWVLYGSDPEALRHIGGGVAEMIHRSTRDIDKATTYDKDQFTEALGRSILNMIETPVHGPRVTWSGLHATLDREAINRIIRVLRKARDQAFGPDE